MITTANNTALNQMAIIRARMEGHTVYFKDFDDGDSKYHVFPRDYSFRFNSHIYKIAARKMRGLQPRL